MTLEEEIRKLASVYSVGLKKQIDNRVIEMELDDTEHYIIYQVLGITPAEGKLIDVYQNKGRFLYKYAGSFLEEATILCFERSMQEAKRKVKIPNKISPRPKTFEIDCLTSNRAYEIKWRDATTDGDHITKEHTRIQSIRQAGYIPVRVMFYYPSRSQAKKIQDALQTLYAGVGGEYYYGENAWNHVRTATGIDLLGILERIAKDNARQRST